VSGPSQCDSLRAEYVRDGEKAEGFEGDCQKSKTVARWQLMILLTQRARGKKTDPGL
jgi:hypothetical protein